MVNAPLAWCGVLPIYAVIVVAILAWMKILQGLLLELVGSHRVVAW